MWNRACPLCFAKMPRALLLVHTDEVTCPSCRTPLEVSRSSRVLGAMAGCFLGYAVFLGVLPGGSELSWFVPMVGAILGFAVGSALALFFLSDLVVRPAPPGGRFPHIHG